MTALPGDWLNEFSLITLLILGSVSEDLATVALLGITAWAISKLR